MKRISVFDKRWCIVNKFLHVLQRFIHASIRSYKITFIGFILLYCMVCVSNVFALSTKSQSYEFPELDGNFMLWQQQCSQKNYVVCYLLGVAYYKGYQVLPNPHKAQKFLMRACRKGIAESCMALNSIDSNNPKNFEAYEEMCNFNNAQECKKLSDYLATNISKNLALTQKEKILTLLQKSCKLQVDSTCSSALTFASKFLAMETTETKIEKMNFQNALNTCNTIQETLSQRLPLNSFSSNQLQSCIQVAKMYANGDGVAKNKDFAKRYFAIACYYDTQSCYDRTLDTLLNP